MPSSELMFQHCPIRVLYAASGALKPFFTGMR